MLGDRAYVAVLDPLPLFQRGVMDALTGEDTVVEVPPDIRAWAESGGRRVMLLTLAASTDWDLLEELAGKILVVAVLEENVAASSIRALRLGAESIVMRNATSAHLRRVLDSVLAGEATVPRSVIRALVSSSRAHGVSAPELPAEEMRWLRELASGVTVAHLASQAGYSERAMYRLLNGIYARLGVTNRTEALMRANAYGWFDSEM